MKPNHLEELLKQDAPAPDPEARVAARRAALAEFARVNATPAAAPAKPPVSAFQGLLARLRLSREPQANGSDSMRWFNDRMWVGAAASVCIALVGSAVVWNTLREEPRVSELRGSETAVRAAPMASLQGSSSEVPVDATSASAADAMVARPDEPVPPPGLAKPGEVGPGESGRDKLPLEADRQAVLAGAQQRDQAMNQAAEKAQAGRLSKDDARTRGDEMQSVVVSSPESPPRSTQEMKREISQPTAVQSIQAESLMDQMVVEERAAGGKSKNAQPVAATPMAAPAPPPPSTAMKRAMPSTAGGLLSFSEPAQPAEYEGRDRFEQFEINSIKQPSIAAERVSTFSADVDTSSYSFVRKQLDRGVLPQKDSVRAEEMINYFGYAWPAAASRERPFQPTVVVSDSPWGKGRKLIHIGIKGYELPARQRPDANLVLLLDVSGSMSSPDKLPLVKQSMKLLLGSLKPTDTVGIVVYAGAAGQVLAPTPAGEKDKIIAALDSLTPGGSTAGAEGIELAYQLAEKSFRKEGVNRIILCTDGDFNVGIDSTNELKGFVERKREKGVFLSVLGFGQGNYRDELAQALAQNGNGVAAYIDTLSEAQKVLVQEAGSSLFTIAKDVKLQVEFNPATVAEYRLVGYETRALKREDFNNDAVDAGDVGSGHTVTAIYEITPVGSGARMIEESRYEKKAAPEAGTANEYGFLRIRYKLPKDSESQLIEQPIRLDSGRVPEAIQRDVQFSTAVAGFAQLLRGGTYTGSLSYDDVIKQGLAARGEDPYGYRNEFVQLVRKAQTARGM